MKKIFTLTVLLALTACGMAPPAKMAPVYLQPANALAAGQNSNFEWNCVQNESTVKLSGLDCTFHNISTTAGEKEMCLRAFYYTGVSNELVTKSRLACSGTIGKDGVGNTLVYFQRQARQEMLAMCGIDNSFCKLIVLEEKK
jgi:hypothetical protein